MPLLGRALLEKAEFAVDSLKLALILVDLVDRLGFEGNQVFPKSVEALVMTLVQVLRFARPGAALDVPMFGVKAAEGKKKIIGDHDLTALQVRGKGHAGHCVASGLRQEEHLNPHGPFFIFVAGYPHEYLIAKKGNKGLGPGKTPGAKPVLQGNEAGLAGPFVPAGVLFEAGKERKLTFAEGMDDKVVVARFDDKPEQEGDRKQEYKVVPRVDKKLVDARHERGEEKPAAPAVEDGHHGRGRPRRSEV